MINHNSKNGVNDQWVISSWLITYLGEGWECRYLIGIDFRYALRWVGATHVRCWEDELRFGKVSVMLREEFWVVGLNWNALKLKNCISILNGETRVCSKMILAFQAWFLSGTPSPIYTEGDGVVWREKGSGLLRKYMWSESCSWMDYWGFKLARVS